MKTLVFTLTLSGLLSLTPAIGQQQVPFAGDRVAAVMTLNVYHGVDAELATVLTPPPPNLFEKVAAVYLGYFQRNFPERASAFAAEIEAKQPDLIGLQEAILVRTQSPPDGLGTPAGTVALDFVQILLNALAARGLHYEVAVQAFNSDRELPSALGFDVRQTDREVILARADLTTADLKFSNAQGGIFTNICAFPSPIGPITDPRGWVAVDAKIRGKSFRFIGTHLDATCLAVFGQSAIQQAQAAELLAGPAATALPVVLVGDLNSPGDGTGATYNDLIDAGFGDAVVEAGTGSTPTCCQAANLLNAASIFDHRSDYILFREGFTVLDAEVSGEEPGDKTPSGLWPSDHAGVAARLELPQP